MAFKDAGEVRKYIGGIFESAFADPEIGPKLAATGVVLGFEFSDEVKDVIARIQNYPLAWTPLSKRSRRAQVHRFPYSIIYEVRGDLIIIVAIQHHRRKPMNWRKQSSA